VTGGVVVGFDGSGPARRALEWAWREAAAHDRPLHVVRAWTLPAVLAEVGVPDGVVPSMAECAAAVAAQTRRTIDEIAASEGTTPVVHVHVVHGPATDVLDAAIRRADLVVVGHRGHNLWTLVLGSVATHVLEHARCPVVVLPLT
jgi:nucleotide-binding universal stress UspA family protein